mgnify:CR=1 FL=1
MKKTLLLLVLLCTVQLLTHARIWRVNNTAGLAADFSTLSAAVSSASVLAGDTVHVEPSATAYTFFTLNKRLIFFGVGYLLDPANATTPGNAGLHVSTVPASIPGMTLAVGSEGSRFQGLAFTSSIAFGTGVTNANIVFEKCYFSSGVFPGSGNYSNLTFRKCYFDNSRIEQTSGSMSSFVCENCIFNGGSAYVNMTALTGTNNVVRNNSFNGANFAWALSNAYFANNIVGSASILTFTNCVVKNNIFQLPNTAGNQQVPITATGNQFNIPMNTVYLVTGSYDARFQLRSGSPAIGQGVTIAGFTPDCGAFGATDPYKLSGIPNIPSIYSLTVPVSIPAGTSSMNVTVSTRNNN